MNGEEVLRVPSQPGTDIGEMIVHENRGCLDIERYDALVWGGEKRPLVALDAVGEPVGLIAIINPDSYESLWPYSPPGPTP